MKHALIVCIVLSISSIVHAQTGGQLDPTFGSSGKVIKSINAGSDKANGLAMLSDGSFLVAGETVSGVTGKDFFIVKFTANGAIDNSFGANGTVTTDLQTGSDDVAHSIAVDDSGRIVLAGSSDNGTKQYAALVRYKSNGQRDSAFGTNGIVLTSCITANADAYSKVRIHALTGKIIAVGNSEYSSTSATEVVARYNSNGTLDATFNSTGINTLTGVGNGYSVLSDLYVAPSGKITAVGWITNSSLNYLYDGWIVRLNSNGVLDNTFGTGGTMLEDYMSFNTCVYVDQGTGLIYTSGSVVAYFGQSQRNERITIKRAGANGTDDTWANAGGNAYHYTTETGAPCFGNAMCVTPDGKFIVAGTAYTSTQSAGMLIKFEATGGADYTFGSPNSGQVIESFGATQAEMLDIVLQPDGKVVVVGFTGNDMFIARYFGTTVPQLNSFNLVSPANNSTELICSDVELQWSDAPGAIGYEVQVDTTQNFNTPATDNVSSSELLDYQMSLETAETYYWRVRAYNTTNYGSWKGPWKFTTTLDNITLVSPANGATNVQTSSVYFDWTDLVSSTINVLQQSFDFQISTDSNFSGAPIINNLSFDNSNHTLSTSLATNTTYYWRVRSNRGVYKKGPWSAFSRFTTVNPTAIAEEKLKHVEVFVDNDNQVLVINAHGLKDVGVSIFGVDGKLLQRVEHIQAGGLNMQYLPAGIYYAQVTVDGASKVQVWSKTR